jgi:glycosyltransferase involved in cell wall biosynthesis
MRITIVIAGLGGGGAERVAINLANAWSTEYTPTLLTISQKSIPPAYAVSPDVERRDVGWPRAAREYELNAQAIAPIIRGLHANDSNVLMVDITMLALLRFAIVRTEPEVVVSFITQTNVRVLAALHESNLPVIVCEVTDARRLNMGDWQRPRDMFYRHAAAVVAPDPVIAEWLGTRGAKALSIHNPLQPPASRLPPAAPIRSNNSSRKRVITLSRFSSEKRVEFLVRAFSSLAERYPDWYLEIYGDGAQRNFLEHLAEDLAPPGRIRICGFTNDPYTALAGADIFVSASWIEGFGNSIWEALACGVPVVAIEAGPSVRALVRHEVDGLVVNQANVPGLAAALDRLMSNEAERKSFALRAPEVVERFSMQSALEQWKELLSPFHTR